MAKKKAKSTTKRGITMPVNPKTDRQYQVQDAARTLLDVEKLRQDRGLMRDAKRYLTKQAQLSQRAAKRVK